MTSHCLVLLVRDGALLLARKRRGFGAGRLVAPGGKIEPGESARDAAARELREETGLVVAPASLVAAGVVRFRFGAAPEVMEVALFRATDTAGEPVATDELEEPAFYPADDLPHAEMWADDPYWLPDVLAGEYVDVAVCYDEAASRIVRVDPTPRLALVVLVDRRGWLLLQERDEHAPLDPLRWGIVGGRVEDGESFEAAAYRELAEETGLSWTTGLALWTERSMTYGDPVRTRHTRVWTAAVDLTDADISCGEGRQIVFVDPARVLGLDLAGNARILLPELLGSATYRALAISG